MINKKMGKVAICAASVLTAGMFFISQPFSALAATGTVTSSNVKVRAEANTGSAQVSSLDSGDKVDIIDETTDSQGYVWYRIYVNGTEYGYVRSDLVSKSGDTSSTSTSTQKAALPETSVTAIESQAATVTVASANVRSGAGTGYDTVGTVANGDTVTVTGEANGTDSKKWYQISFGSSGRTGFVRADLVQLGAAAPAADAEAGANEEGAVEEEAGEGGEAVEGAEGEGAENAETDPNVNTEVPIDTTVGNGEFSLAYKDDGTGADTWYLYDNVEGTQVKLNDLLTYAASGQQADALKTQVGKLKIALIVMAVLIALLVLAVLLLVYKLRDYAYYEEEEVQEAPKSRKKDNYDELPPQKPVRKPVEPKQTVAPKSNGRTVADSKRAPMGTAESLLGAERSERVARPASQPAPGRASESVSERPSRQPQTAGRSKPRNFLFEDDDFEFEFLNLDDEDK